MANEEAARKAAIETLNGMIAARLWELRDINETCGSRTPIANQTGDTMTNARVFAQRKRRTAERRWAADIKAGRYVVDTPNLSDPALWRHLELPSDVAYYVNRWGYGAAGKVLDYLRERSRETVRQDEKRSQLALMVQIVERNDRRNFRKVMDLLMDDSGDLDPRYSVESQVQ